MRCLFACLTICLAGHSCLADDWPQWMGPNRDNVWRETGLIDSFPAGGPKVLWKTPVAGGYAGPSVANGRVYVTDYVSKGDVQVDNFSRKEFSGTERVLCLDEKTGQVIWKHEYPVTYGISYPAGPQCTPNYNEIDRMKVIEPSNVAMGRRVVWAAPAWANKKVFIRNDKECVCIDLSAEGGLK